MLKIVIQSDICAKVINNVHPDELTFWRNLLEETVRGRGDIQVLRMNAKDDQVA